MIIVDFMGSLYSYKEKGKNIRPQGRANEVGRVCSSVTSAYGGGGELEKLESGNGERDNLQQILAVADHKEMPIMVLEQYN
ncbi:unnamed protein product [Caenorhabditis angaria]|uniref:Uncharacterized protein n=1 Tax=Caenorhabditis angaria TaxID=860376 RepID=A0A9P1N9J1_9PELO|nr:unnamed protein product [Caenorhabditis angaria]